MILFRWRTLQGYGISPSHARATCARWFRPNSGTQETGHLLNTDFRSADTVERAMLEQHEMEFLYSDGSPPSFHEHRKLRDRFALSADDWVTPRSG